MTDQPNSTDSPAPPTPQPTHPSNTCKSVARDSHSSTVSKTLSSIPHHPLQPISCILLLLHQKPNRSMFTPSCRPPNFCQSFTRMLAPSRNGQTTRVSVFSQILHFLDTVVVLKRHSESIHQVPHCHRTDCPVLYDIEWFCVISAMRVAWTSAVPEEIESCDLPRHNHGPTVSLHDAAINVLSWWVPISNR